MDTKMNKFRGSLVASCIGDCLGAPFEGAFWNSTVELHLILQKIGIPALEKKTSGKMRFTDDTAMARSVCASLVKCKEFDAVDMATRFTKEYINEPFRGYGGGVKDIFNYWKNNGVNNKNVLVPSNGQFNGSGSYGNGAAMRVAPVALYAKDCKECLELAKKTALLTHSSKHGYLGAMLQALAVYKALNEKEISAKQFLQDLKNELLILENELYENTKKDETHKDNNNRPTDADDILYDYTRSTDFRYSKQMDVIQELLDLHEKNKEENDLACVRERLGFDVSAQQAVPTAIYSFLRNLDKGYEQTLHYAISIGGDTDTIACMCLSIAGGYYGYAALPAEWIQACEGTKEMKQYADQLLELHDK